MNEDLHLINGQIHNLEDKYVELSHEENNIQKQLADEAVIVKEQVTLEVDGTGKKKFTNELLRSNEVTRRLENNDLYKSQSLKKDKIRKELQLMSNQVSFLKRKIRIYEILVRMGE